MVRAFSVWSNETWTVKEARAAQGVLAVPPSGLNSPGPQAHSPHRTGLFFLQSLPVISSPWHQEP